jgi:hypothetical protein
MRDEDKFSAKDDYPKENPGQLVKLETIYLKSNLVCMLFDPDGSRVLSY